MKILFTICDVIPLCITLVETARILTAVGAKWYSCLILSQSISQSVSLYFSIFMPLSYLSVYLSVNYCLGTCLSP